jgi:TatD DNase family protein
VANRGRRNEPAFVKDVVAALAAARSSDFASTAALTAANARRLFRLAD